MTRTRGNSANRGWTYADYCRIPEDGSRHEIIDGRHFVAPAPEIYHQDLALGLASALRTLIQEVGLGRVCIAPVDLHLGRGTIVQPDILAVRTARAAIVGQKKITGVPDLVVEILSPSTAAHRRDRELKLHRYERAGVAEYLIADPATRTIDQFTLRRGGYAPPRVCHDRLELVAFAGVVLDLRRIW